MALQLDPPYLGDIGDAGRQPRCDLAGTLHARDCICEAEVGDP